MSKRSPNSNVAAGDDKHPGGFSRREMLVHAGTATLALSALGQRALGSEPTGEAFGGAAPAGSVARPLLGALYLTRFASHDRSWFGLPQLSALGAYDSGNEGIIDAQRSLALGSGISFFLAPFRHEGGSSVELQNLDKAIRRAHPSPLKIAVLLEADEASTLLHRAHRQSLLRAGEFVSEMAAWLVRGHDLARSQGWLDSPAYLRAPEGRSIFGFVSRTGPKLTAAVLAEALTRRPDIADGCALWCAHTARPESHAAQVSPIQLPGNAAFFRLAPGTGQAWSSRRSFYEQLGARGAQRVISVSPAQGVPGRREASPRGQEGVLAQQLVELERLDLPPTHVLIDSFNDWRAQTAIEPGTLDGRRHLALLSQWKRS